MDNKAALRQLLMWKRRQLDPARQPDLMGWTPRRGRGRRAPGLSQAQVAQLLHVSERTYADFERGEKAAPTLEFLDDTARVLHLREYERVALYVYAVGYEPPHPLDPLAGRTVPAIWDEAVRHVTGQACYVNDVAWNVVAYNDEFVRMFPRAPDAEPVIPERNLMRYVLLNNAAREHHLVNWESEWAVPLSAQLRNAVAQYPGNADLQRLDEEVAADPVSGPIYRANHVASVHPNGDTRRMRYPWYGPPDEQVPLDRCCQRHAHSQEGDVTMCAAMPLGSPGARFFLLVFKPDLARQPDGQDD
ncbi:helix-turn-helix domain-containing protein [Streptomyces kanamyceticus]|uniref:XRE family transcriptional regulator n=1 Tax=Streptomyces kanamyceticus TaxID=1967 RepID=A0A5J6GPP1_STRKN|nr:helix-turn-helix domain-containing protein [Streptomyces kanamyceticus]QEU96953.1 XRE family transcriptional regulator [Streptomyces kanamyceticus]